ncbi:putative esterase [Pedobacter sp. UYP30]|uniref:alpha/beta hydrolase family protein n=1 Tax=Pedobacter sp. UYP30 TaxID=1756400 RepID=UPI0033914DD5
MKSLILFFLLFPTIVFCQDLGKVDGLNSRHFQLKGKQDTINFILINDRIDTVKPLLIFCQGSTPVPLVIQYAQGSKFIPALSAFNYQEIAKKYHLVIISMPKTPFEVKIDKLNKFYNYVPDTAKSDSLSNDYLKNNYLDNYVSRAKKVIKYLYRQKWINKKKIIVVGHSQGAKVALEIAVNNRKIYKIGFLCGNPFGRLDQYIRLERYFSITGKKTPQESQAMIDNYYKVWEDVIAHPKDLEVKYGDPSITWTSFDKPLLADFLKIKIPIYVAYGTEDFRSVMCDLLPIYFISAGKENLTMKPYVGLEHNFMELDKNRNPIVEKMHWQEVIDNLTTWIEEK